MPSRFVGMLGHVAHHRLVGLGQLRERADPVPSPTTSPTQLAVRIYALRSCCDCSLRSRL